MTISRFFVTEHRTLSFLLPFLLLKIFIEILFLFLFDAVSRRIRGARLASKNALIVAKLPANYLVTY